jgi:hypothetical protein
MNAIVILNEQHELMEEQTRILNEKYEYWKICSVPAAGWTLEEQKEIAYKLSDEKADKVMGSPVPYLSMHLAAHYAANCEMGDGRPVIFYGQVCLFHNDRREKKELPGGKIINIVAQTGWQLITI